MVSTTAGRGCDCPVRHGIPHADTDLATALADPRTDAVCLSATNERHRDNALAVADAAEMARAARAAGVTFATNHNLRRSGNHRAFPAHGCLNSVLRAPGARMGRSAIRPGTYAAPERGWR
ncbi:hypothetical protein [Rhodobacter sp. 24-YEA-8]|uniref:hypothetical protein n=1 Tax=Rhodobacter sp. 24-YEA-8 TaxID=1884310 RepID=UPI00089980B5|nr:hypothetical protein [Rhodobacter sp. 24-YEA-8]SEB40698.1 1,5-anhydro-D-fructose reductase (1,5-anhydro-D-mannitol-forming) [Rhodobacter sp. 24-YEA-8]